MVGKKIGNDFYIHISAISSLSEIYMTMLNQTVSRTSGSVILRKANKHNLVLKFNIKKNTVSFLTYDNFKDDPHPGLSQSIIFKLDNYSWKLIKFKTKPILHRKDLVVSSNYSRYLDFVNLSKQEAFHGLLGRRNIGSKKNWDSLLQESGLKIVDHKLVEA